MYTNRSLERTAKMQTSKGFKNVIEFLVTYVVRSVNKPANGKFSRHFGPDELDSAVDFAASLLPSDSSVVGVEDNSVTLRFITKEL
jgi:hypothetical protein